ncbi:hypothetical protein HMSSN036_23790 [Paenibacillus macerans]|nr:hypothetical protein HMSSN036_23790 [Paenibacillus macerans]
MATRVLEICKKFDIKVSYFVDNNSSKWKGKFKNYDIVSPDFLLLENPSNIFILVASMYYRQISQQLVSMGFTEYTNFLFGLDIESVNL